MSTDPSLNISLGLYSSVTQVTRRQSLRACAGASMRGSEASRVSCEQRLRHSILLLVPNQAEFRGKFLSYFLTIYHLKEYEAEKLMETMTRPGAPGDPAILLSRLLGNNSNYIVINLSEERHPDHLNASQTVRHPILCCYVCILSSMSGPHRPCVQYEHARDSGGGLHRADCVQPLGLGLRLVLHQVPGLIIYRSRLILSFV